MKRCFYNSFKEVDIHKERNPAKKSAYDYFSRRGRSPYPYRRESSERAHSGFTNCSSEDDYKSFWSFPKEEFKIENYSIPTETRSQEPESKSGGLRDFIPELHALPTELFLKIVLLKLDEMEMDEMGFAELSELAKFLIHAQEVFAKALPPEILAVIRQMMFNKVRMNSPKTPATQPVNTQVFESRKERKDLPAGRDFSLIREILKQTKRKDLPPLLLSATVSPLRASSNVASHQNDLSYSGSTHGNVNSPCVNTYTPSSNQSYSYNTASSNMTHGIPGLTLTEQRESYSAYNAYHSPYSEPSLSNYHNLKF